MLMSRAKISYQGSGGRSAEVFTLEAQLSSPFSISHFHYPEELELTFTAHTDPPSFPIDKSTRCRSNSRRIRSGRPAAFPR